jgi:hypothetical protein
MEQAVSPISGTSLLRLLRSGRTAPGYSSFGRAAPGYSSIGLTVPGYSNDRGASPGSVMFLWLVP